MHFNFNEQSASLLFFFAQGLIFAGLLLQKGIRQEDAASKWLSLFVFLCSLYLSIWMCGHAGWYARDHYREFLFFFPTQQLYLLGPVIFFYTKSLLNPQFRLKKQDLWHFAPAAAYLLYTLVVFVVDALILDEYYFYADGRDKDLAPWYQITGFASMIVYTALSIKAYQSYRHRIFNELSFADTVVFNWLRQFLLVLLLILSLRVLFLVLYPHWGDFGTKWWYYFLFAILTYYLALKGYTHTIERFSPFRQALPPPILTEQVFTSEPSSLPPPELKNNIDQIRQLLEQNRLFENPTLTLSDLAKALDSNSKQVSATINQAAKMNFNDFINTYRVEDFKSRIQQGDHHRYTLLSIALECGFNSKSTFNRVFKKLSGMTPLQYAALHPDAPN